MDHLLVKTAYLKEIAPLTKTYTKGDSGPEIVKVKEWLMLWQLNQNYASVVLHIKGDRFDDDMQTVLENIQGFLNLDKTGIVDANTWTHMVAPMAEAFDLNSFNQTTLREKMKYYATKHLQFRASELEEDNMGPWVRAYMDTHEGISYYWCAGFVSSILDQTFSSIGQRFDQYYPNSWLVEDFRDHAREKGLLVTHEALKTENYVPQTGDLVIFISDKDKRAHHIEVLYEVLDTAKGNMLNIGGNTNFSGSRNGVGTFLVDRNFMDADVEIIKLVDKSALR